nr:GNAT family N-acetyltransferase [Bacillus salacetis]
MERSNVMSEVQQGSNKFYLGKTEMEPEAELVYKENNGEMVIEHTVVSENLRGQGVGGQLVDKAVQFAREKGLKVDSECPYAKEVLENNEGYQDVLK